MQVYLVTPGGNVLQKTTIEARSLDGALVLAESFGEKKICGFPMHDRGLRIESSAADGDRIDTYNQAIYNDHQWHWLGWSHLQETEHAANNENQSTPKEEDL